jgi:4-amino-4-deoxychorismate lyase
MSPLVETIRIEDGVPANLSFHNERMVRSVRDLFSVYKKIDLAHILTVPSDAVNGIFKCRVIYDSEIRKIEFIPYSIRQVNTLQVVFDDDISYPYKFTDRKRIDELMELKGDRDDILIIKNGKVTDTSYANVVLSDNDGNWITPATYLLPGTRRASLLKSGIISAAPVSASDLKNYTLLKLINAMIGIEDTTGIPVGNIVF